MPLQTFPYDSAEYLDTAETIAWFIRETIVSGDADEFVETLDIVERARRMHGIVGRDGTLLHGSDVARPEEAFGALLAILGDLGFTLTVQPVEVEQAAEAA